MVHALYPRLAAQALRESLTDTPVVLIHGPRQCGKTTLAKDVGGDSGYVYFSFDDATTLAAAQTDPNGFVADPPSGSSLTKCKGRRRSLLRSNPTSTAAGLPDDSC